MQTKTTLTIEVTPEWLERVTELAKRCGTDLSSFVRDCADPRARPAYFVVDDIGNLKEVDIKPGSLIPVKDPYLFDWNQLWKTHTVDENGNLVLIEED